MKVTRSRIKRKLQCGSVGIEEYIKRAYTQSDADHNDHLRAIPDEDAKCYHAFRGAEDFAVDELPSAANSQLIYGRGGERGIPEVFLHIFLRKR